MKVVLSILFFLVGSNVCSAQDITTLCCNHGKEFAKSIPTVLECTAVDTPDSIPIEDTLCPGEAQRCCELELLNKEECEAGAKLAIAKRCSVPKSEVGKICCEECSLGRLTGDSQGKESCGSPVGDDVSPFSAQRKNVFHKCCLQAAEEQEITTARTEATTTTSTTTTSTTTTPKPRETCATHPCDHICNDDGGKVICICRSGYMLQPDKKTCLDINECAESLDDLCTTEGTVCHNTPGSFKCVPLFKRDTRNTSCPPGFKWNAANRVCDDINECQLPSPPCPKYLCENTIGGFKCAGKAGTPASEASLNRAPPAAPPSNDDRNEICPPGFRAGPDDECVDINECDERLDDCQRLSQHCINSHGSFFCQDHVSKRCAPGFKVNPSTGVCEDIDECEESSEVCQRNEVCVNLAGAYNCKSKISTLPKLGAKKICQEGTRRKPGGTVCEDIDECREGTHLCDQFQNCINTFGGHECRCKAGFELDSLTGSCADIDECTLRLDNCPSHARCVNVLGSFMCTSDTPSTTPPAPPPPSAPSADYEYEYYDSSEENTTTGGEWPSPPNQPNPKNNYPPPPAPLPPALPTTTSTSTTQSPIPRPYTPPKPADSERSSPTDTRRPVYRRPRPDYSLNSSNNTVNILPERKPLSTTSSTTTLRPTTTIRTSINTTPAPRRRPYYPFYRPEQPTTNEVIPTPESPRPDYSRPDASRPEYSRPDSSTTEISRAEYPRPDSSRSNTRRPDSSRPESSRPETPRRRPAFVEVPKPLNPVVIETDRRPDGGLEIDTNDIPRNKWTNVIGRDPPTQPDIDLNNLHCLDGYEKNANGECVDINECDGNRYICSSLEVCQNRPGGYVCECMAGFHRDPTGWCVVNRVPNSTTTTTTTSTTTTTTTRRPTTTSTTTTTTTERPRPVEPTPYYPVRPYSPRPYVPSESCELGFKFDFTIRSCIDIDECTTNTARCAASEECINVPGGYRCSCGAGCRSNTGPGYEVGPPSSQPSNVITVGAQYGQRGAGRMARPKSRYRPDYGMIYSCPWGYALTPSKQCVDIDECATNNTQCGPQQRCENFFGGYSCQCPDGHRLVGSNTCEDVDECAYGHPCPYNAQCINTVGSYRCSCGDGFRNAPSNDKVCVDVDECVETPTVCEQGCVNVWGGYRCYCPRGYRLNRDNRTCADVDECAEWGGAGGRVSAVCVGKCVNTRGSYSCACPQGYRLASDQRSCIDIDECENGEARCAHSAQEVCLNTRGSYHCHRIDCPPGYRLDSKHSCAMIQQSCLYNDYACIRMPKSYHYHFITFVSNIYLPRGSVDLFTMHGPLWSDATLNFNMVLIDSQAQAPNISPAGLNCFQARPMGNMCAVSLLCSLPGPQVIELELTMSLYMDGMFRGNAISRLIIVVSEYEY